MKLWKCRQCIHGASFKKQIDIKTPLPSEVVYYREYKAEIIKDDNEECKYYCCEAR